MLIANELWILWRESAAFAFRNSYFEEGCRKKCMRQSRKVLWVVLSSLFIKEIWKNGPRRHGRMFAYVCECESRATKVGLTATVVRNSVLIISHITLSRAHFFPTTFSNSCIRPFNRPLVLYLRGLFWCLLDLSGMSFLREGKTGFKKACLSIYVVSERAFIYGSGVCKFRRHVCKIFPRAN